MVSIAFLTEDSLDHRELKMLHLVLLYRLPLPLLLQFILFLLNINLDLLNLLLRLILLQHIPHHIVLTAPYVLQQALPRLPHSLDRGTSLLLRSVESSIWILFYFAFGF